MFIEDAELKEKIIRVIFNGDHYTSVDLTDIGHYMFKTDPPNAGDMDILLKDALNDRDWASFDLDPFPYFFLFKSAIVTDTNKSGQEFCAWLILRKDGPEFYDSKEVVWNSGFWVPSDKFPQTITHDIYEKIQAKSKTFCFKCGKTHATKVLV